MYCHQCGKEIPNDAKFCNYCGAVIPDAAPRHARPEEELYSYSEENRPTEFDVNDADKFDKTKVYNFSAFEEPEPAVTEPDEDDRELLDDSYENYQDGEDDDTFMDKLDHQFRRDEDRKPQNSKTWLWITLGVLAAVLIIVFAILAFSGSIFKGNNAKPTAAPTAATVKATETTKPTEAPKPTQAPVTQAPATQAPAPTKAPAPTETPDITEAPRPTEAPQPEPTEAPAPTEAPVVSEEPFDSEPIPE